MKKQIIALVLSLVILFSMSACTNSDLFTGEDNSVQTGVKAYGDPKISVDGNAQAKVENGVLKVDAQDEYISDITVDSQRIWLTDGQYTLESCTDKTRIEITSVIREEAAAQKAESVILSIYDSDTNSYSVTWRTEKADYPTVKISSESAPEEKTVSAYCDECDTGYVNRAVFYNLDYDTEYTYTIYNSNGTELYTDTFKTGSKAPETVTFMHVSDTQDEDYNGQVWAKLMDNAYSNTGSPDFILHTGDMVQYGGKEELWSQMIGNVQSYVSSVPLMLTSGNHSYWSDYLDGASDIEYNHTTIKLPEQKTENGQYYSFDYGDIHFVVLSSGDSESSGVGYSQHKWLEEDLASTDKTWKIVAIHNPLYSTGKYGSDKDRNKVARSQQKKLGKIFNECGVDLVLQGHDHVFCLTPPMDENRNVVKCETKTESGSGFDTTYYVNPQAPVYLMSGAGGSQNREAFEEYEESWFSKAMDVPDNTAGYSIVTISGKKLTATYYEYNYSQNTGKVSYSWGIEKG